MSLLNKYTNPGNVSDSRHINSILEGIYKCVKCLSNLPIATATVLGGIKVGSGLTIDVTGVLSVDRGVPLLLDINETIEQGIIFRDIFSVPGIDSTRHTSITFDISDIPLGIIIDYKVYSNDQIILTIENQTGEDFIFNKLITIHNN